MVITTSPGPAPAPTRDAQDAMRAKYIARIPAQRQRIADARAACAAATAAMQAAAHELRDAEGAMIALGERIDALTTTTET